LSEIKRCLICVPPANSVPALITSRRSSGRRADGLIAI